jgi:hypothetical protein
LVLDRIEKVHVEDLQRNTRTQAWEEEQTMAPFPLYVFYIKHTFSKRASLSSVFTRPAGAGAKALTAAKEAVRQAITFILFCFLISRIYLMWEAIGHRRFLGLLTTCLVLAVRDLSYCDEIYSSRTRFGIRTLDTCELREDGLLDPS